MLLNVHTDIHQDQHINTDYKYNPSTDRSIIDQINKVHASGCELHDSSKQVSYTLHVIAETYPI